MTLLAAILTVALAAALIKLWLLTNTLRPDLYALAYDKLRGKDELDATCGSRTIELRRSSYDPRLIYVKVASSIHTTAIATLYPSGRVVISGQYSTSTILEALLSI